MLTPLHLPPASISKITEKGSGVMSGSKVYSIHGRGLKLDSKEDIDPYLKELQALTNVEEIHIGG